MEPVFEINFATNENQPEVEDLILANIVVFYFDALETDIEYLQKLKSLNETQLRKLKR